MNYAWGTLRGGLALLGFVGATLGCAPATYMAPELGVNEPLTFAELLQLERNVIAGRFKLNARVPAHFISQKVDGSSEGTLRLDHPSAPDAYTIDSSPSTQSWQYHMAYAGQRLIAEQYAATHPRHVVFRNFTSIRRIVEEADGNLYALNPYLEDRRPDIADVSGRFVFEIKPYGPNHLEKGKATVKEHVRVINHAMDGEAPFKLGAGFRGEVGVRFEDDVPAWKIEWDTADGVVQYRWQRLDTEDDDEDDCRDAYEANQWRDLTAEEMALHARRMHQVVEHLVRERESMGQPRAAGKMPLVLAGTSADFERSARQWSTDDESPWLLPVMRKPPMVAQAKPGAKVRPDPRLVAQTVVGGGGNAPGGYTAPGKPGEQAWRLHRGMSAHKVIGEHYKLTHPPATYVMLNFITLSTIVKEADGKDDLLLPSERQLKPDITHIQERVVFEIKPDSPDNLKAGQTEVTHYITALNRAMPSKPFSRGTGYDGEVGVKFADGLKTWNLKWRNAAPGVLLYKWRKLGVNKKDEARAEALKKAQDEGRWKDLTEVTRLNQVYQKAYEDGNWVDVPDEEMEAYAEQLEKAVDMLVENREKIRKAQQVANIPIDITGIAASSVLSAELSRIMADLGSRRAPQGAPASVPATPPPAPRSVPMPRDPAPAPGIRVPPPPPPAAKPPLRKAAKLQRRQHSI